MSRAVLHSALQSRSRHFSPFLVLGDPDPERCLELADAAIDAGATMLELGLPYRDPCGDGTAIQDACARALAAGTTTAVALQLLGRLRERWPSVPTNLLVYGNLVHARGYDSFCRSAAAAGASSLLVPDIPLEESDPLRAACAAAELAHVPLVGPATPPTRLRALDRAAAGGFLYVCTRQGVTGTDGGERALRELRRHTATVTRPCCLGFGLSRPEQVAAAFGAGAQIAVVGSHLARLIATTSPRQLVDAFGAACSRLAAPAA